MRSRSLERHWAPLPDLWCAERVLCLAGTGRTRTLAVFVFTTFTSKREESNDVIRSLVMCRPEQTLVHQFLCRRAAATSPGQSYEPPKCSIRGPGLSCVARFFPPQGRSSRSCPSMTAGLQLACGLGMWTQRCF